MKLFLILLVACSVAETAPGCKTDSDCRLEADYCKACDCRALGPGEKQSPCDGPGVRCIQDPCKSKTAQCRAGKCEVIGSM